jgi:TRAP-type mannitol/chloroaromatic compound transport system permease small subunit
MQVGGLPLLPYLKSLILVMAFLLALQSASVAIRAVAVIAGARDVLFPARQAVSEG